MIRVFVGLLLVGGTVIPLSAHAVIGANCTTNAAVCSVTTEICACDNVNNCGANAPKHCVARQSTDECTGGNCNDLNVVGGQGGNGTFAGIVNGTIVPLVDGAIIPLLYALAFLVFLYGVFRFFFSDNEERRKEGRPFVLWGLIGFAVLFSLWGLVKLGLSVLNGG